MFAFLIFQLSLPEGVSIDVVVSSIVDAGHIFIQQPTHPSYPSLERLNQFMISCYMQDGLVPQLPRPLEGQSLWDYLQFCFYHINLENKKKKNLTLELNYYSKFYGQFSQNSFQVNAVCTQNALCIWYLLYFWLLFYSWCYLCSPNAEWLVQGSDFSSVWGVGWMWYQICGLWRVLSSTREHTSPNQVRGKFNIYLVCDR